MRFSLDRFKTRRFAAVDFDSRTMRVVHAEQAGGRIRILKLAASPAPEGLDFNDPKAVGAFLGKTLKDMRLAGTPVMMDVPRGLAVLKPLSLPSSTGSDELASMVRYQVEKELPFRAEEAVIDFTVESHYDSTAAPADGASTSVLVAAVRLPVVDHYRQIAQAAGVKLQRLGLRPYANMRCMEACGVLKDRACVALACIGADETEIDVFSGESLAFSRSAVVRVPPPGQQVVESTEGVETPMAGVANQASESVGAVVMEVIRSLQSYQAVQGSGKTESVVIAGGTGIEKKVAEELRRRLGVPCDLLNPSRPLGLLDDGQTGSFMSALGLAVGSRAAGELPLDFLAPKRPSVKRDMRRVRIGLIAGAAAAVLIGLFVARAWALSDRESRNKVLHTTLEKARKQSDAVRALAKESDSVRTWVVSSPDLLGHWANISILFPPCEEAYITSLKADVERIVPASMPASTSAPTTRSGPQPPVLGKITFNILAKSQDVVADMTERLEKAGYVVNRGKAANVTDKYGYTYSNSITVLLTPRVCVDLTGKAPMRPADDASGDPTYQPPRNQPRTPPPPTRGPGGDPRIIAPNPTPGPTPPDFRSFRPRRGG